MEVDRASHVLTSGNTGLDCYHDCTSAANWIVRYYLLDTEHKRKLSDRITITFQSLHVPHSPHEFPEPVF